MKSLSLARLRGVDTTEGISIGRHCECVHLVHFKWADDISMMALKMLLVVTTTSRSPSDWVVSIQNKDLMSDPHCETGSQDVVAISAANESLITLHEVTALRFLLRQPSPNWKSFSINDITVSHTLYNSLLNSFFTRPIDRCRCTETPSWMQRLPNLYKCKLVCFLLIHSSFGFLEKGSHCMDERLH